MSVTRLTGGLTPGAGGDPRTFPAIWNATADYIENGFRYAGTVYFTSSGSFVKADPLGTGDIGLRAIRVRAVGGGGSGGGADITSAGQTSHGGGGGGGGAAVLFVADVTVLDTSVTVTRGSGGAGVSAGNGSAGGTSSFGSLCVATGGGGGQTVTASNGLTIPGRAGAGGVGTDGDLLIRGSQGSISISQTAAIFQGIAGTGGASIFGGSTGVGAQQAAATVFAGENGGGGNGAYHQENVATAQAGGNGGNGLLAVDCFV
jgi:hypothetical protein